MNKKARKTASPKSSKSAKRKSPSSSHSRSLEDLASRKARGSESAKTPASSCFKGLKSNISRKGAKKVCDENLEIKFRSRYGAERFLRMIDDRRASITGESAFMRFSTNTETGAVDFVDFEDGPTIRVGSRIPGVGIVKSVDKWNYSRSDKCKKDSVMVMFKHDGSG